jgi:hypothetical protein
MMASKNVMRRADARLRIGRSKRRTHSHGVDGFAACRANHRAAIQGERAMQITDQDRRVEELQLAMSRAFEARKTPAVGVLDDGDDVVINVSWVVETGRDATLDARCSAPLRVASRQFERYGAMDMAPRRIVQERDAFDRSRADQANANECSLDIRAADDWFDAPETP